MFFRATVFFVVAADDDAMRHLGTKNEQIEAN